MKIFIVEDLPIVLERLSTMINELPDVALAGDAASEAQAVKGISATLPDLVLLDIHLQAGRGMDVLSWLKQNHPAIKIIVLTNYGYPQYQKRCMALGIDYLLDKAKGMVELKRIISNLETEHSRNR